MQSFYGVDSPNCSISVYFTGTTILAPIYVPYSTDPLTGALANPFTADALGRWGFAAGDGIYDINVDGGSVPERVLSQIALFGSGTWTMLHNNLESIQGGTTNEYYHLTSAEYTGTGTGVFARRVGPKFGSDTDYTTFEAAGVMVAGGSACVWNDWNLTRDFTPNAGAGVPPRNALVGNLVKDQYAIGDAIQYQSAELLHDWKEGTDMHVHIHWATGGLNDATVRGVKWEIEYAVCNMLETGVTPYAFTATSTQSAEASIAANEPDRTHRITSIYTIPASTLKVGAQLMMRLKRIASVINVAPAANPFVISFGVHYQSDTLGSRTIAAK